MSLILLLTSWLARADGTVEGLVLEATDGTPWAGALVEVPEAGATASVGHDGTFVLTLPAGVWHLRVEHRGAVVAIGPVTVVDGRTSEVLATLGGVVPIVTIEAPSEAATPIDAPVARLPVEGRVLDEDGRPVVGARIYVRGEAIEAVTGDDGAFRFDVPPGSRDLSVVRSGYANRSLRVEVGDGMAPLEIRLVEAGARLAAFDVRAPRIEGSTAGLLQERRTAASIGETLGAEQMSKAGDSDAASAIRRVTGLTVVGGRYVYVRGLGDRYAATLLNGSSLPSPEAEKRVVPLDIFPTSILDSVVVQKTASPDRPAEFGGGVVQIRTRSVPTERTFRIAASGGYAGGSTFVTGTRGLPHATDWLGFGAGPRALPTVVATGAADRPIKPRGIFGDAGYDDAQIERFGESFGSRGWMLQDKVLPPDASLSVAYGDAAQVRGGPRLGAWVGLDWGDAWSLDDAVRHVYSFTGGDIVPRRHTRYDQLKRRVKVGALGTLGAAWSEHQEITGTVLLHRIGEHEALSWLADDPTGSSDTRSHRLAWTEQQLLFGQLAGHHRLSEASGVTIDWRYAGSEATRQEPDRREWTYTLTDRGAFLSQKGSWNEILYAGLKDRSHDVGLDLSYAVARRAERPGVVKIGAAWLERRRGSGIRRFSYELQGIEGIDLSAPIHEILVPEHIGASGPNDGGFLTLGEVTTLSDDYTAVQHLRAAYAMMELPIGARLRLMSGARVESSAQRVETLELFNPARAPVRADLATTDILPAATATFAIGPRDARDRALLRAAYGRTVSRPEFRELSEVPFTDFATGALVYGEPELRRALIDHVDLRWELYPSAAESVSVAAFLKSFTIPIEAITEVSAVSGTARTYANAGRATNRGLEVDARLSLGRAHPALEDLFVAGNAAWIHSRVDLSASGGNDTSDERPLQGQSPWVANLQLGWDDPVSGASVALLYNAFGPRIVDVGQSGIPDTFELPVHTVDLVALVPLGSGWRLRLKGSDLLDWPVRERTGDRVALERRGGRGASVQVQWRPL